MAESFSNKPEKNVRRLFIYVLLSVGVLIGIVIFISAVLFVILSFRSMDSFQQGMNYGFCNSNITLQMKTIALTKDENLITEYFDELHSNPEILFFRDNDSYQKYVDFFDKWEERYPIPQEYFKEFNKLGVKTLPVAPEHEMSNVE
jgi:hypothetical protein